MQMIPCKLPPCPEATATTHRVCEPPWSDSHAGTNGPSASAFSAGNGEGTQSGTERPDGSRRMQVRGFMLNKASLPRWMQERAAEIIL